MSLVFAGGTIATYVTLSVAALLGLGRVGMGRFERYSEVLSGGFIALVGLVFAADNGPLSQIQNCGSQAADSLSKDLSAAGSVIRLDGVRPRVAFPDSAAARDRLLSAAVRRRDVG